MCVCVCVFGRYDMCIFTYVFELPCACVSCRGDASFQFQNEAGIAKGYAEFPELKSELPPRMPDERN